MRCVVYDSVVRSKASICSHIVFASRRSSGRLDIVHLSVLLCYVCVCVRAALS
jgi:hypothetical protein